ncbi:unnamed protein product [Phytophthora fragariaefolia]|uniref:Unnamed protein product n=1 Tax=Phytophthora fragariaefolia TaxID=1490495 RepID=A0A9W6WMU0_9STRA|nr:unnamed protein product [Phytophthora fragariaefolia]
MFGLAEKYWALLQMTKVAPKLLDMSKDLEQQDVSSLNPHLLRPSWLECNFVNTLNTLYWGKNSIDDLDIMYFDFVGILSNVGRICRGRKRRLDEDPAEVTEFRWVKMIDSSSTHELVIRLSECSQPSVFRSLQAGNTLMITKLQWVMLPGADSTETRIQYATTSAFSVLRVNEAVRPFHSIEECNLNVFFANNVMKNAMIDSKKPLGESKLTAHIEKKYRSRNCFPVDVDEFKEAFSLKVYALCDLAAAVMQIEAYQHRQLGFVGQVKSVHNNNTSTKERPSVFLGIGDRNNDKDESLTVAVSINPLFQRPSVKGRVKAITSPDALPLIRLLPAPIVDGMLEVATSSKSTGDRSLLSLGFIEEYLVNSYRDYFFSLNLYRDGFGHVIWELDAILEMP